MKEQLDMVVREIEEISVSSFYDVSVLHTLCLSQLTVRNVHERLPLEKQFRKSER